MRIDKHVLFGENMLVALEENNGAGKTTLINNIKKLIGNDSLLISQWNSTESVSKLIRKLRNEEKLRDAVMYEYLQLLDS